MESRTLTAPDVFAACVCLGLSRAARATARRYDAMFKPLGITSGQFSILSALMRDIPVSIGGLADLLAMDRTTLNRNLRPLKAAELVETRQDQRDRRIRRLALTRKGHALLQGAVPLWRAAQRESNRRLGRERWGDLKSAIESLI